MTAPVDPAIEGVNAFIHAMLVAFNPDDTVAPPLGGGSKTVRFIAGSVVAMALWDAHAHGSRCREPFLWVRLVRSFPSKSFPSPALDQDCDLPEVLQIEVGVGRCSSLGNADGSVNWKDQAEDAEHSLDDRHRLRLALRKARQVLKDKTVAIGTLEPAGPDGGVIAWAGTAYVQL